MVVNSRFVNYPITSGMNFGFTFKVFSTGILAPPIYPAWRMGFYNLVYMALNILKSYAPISSKNIRPLC